MKTLLLLRHAQPSLEHAGLNDHDRPLTKRGEKEAPLVGKFLKQKDLVPELVLTSTARRARDTAQAVVKECGFAGDVEPHRDLYLSDTACYLDLLRSLPGHASRVLVVGHNPVLEELLALLTGVPERMNTATLAHIDLPISSWHELNEATRGSLLTLWSPPLG